MAKDKGEKTGKDNSFDIKVVVNGQAVEVKANENAPLQTIVNKALEAGGTAGQNPDSWQLTDEDGKVLDPAMKVGLAGIGAGMTLFLSLKAGAAG